MARSRFRSVTYDLESCLALARQVAAEGGSVDAPTLAVALGYSGDRNGAFLTRLANARLFGLVAGRSGQVSLTERGAAATGGAPAERQRARQDAIRAVPLFAALLEARRGQPLGQPEELAAVLVGEFGEQPSKARTVAAKFARSVGQAGMLRGDPVHRRHELGLTNFTAHPIRASLLFLPGVISRRAAGVGPAEAARGRRGGSADGRDGTVDGTDGGPTRESSEPTPGAPDPARLWLDEPEHTGGQSAPQRRRPALVAAAAACAALIAVPVGLVLASGGGKSPPVALPPVPRHAVGGPAAVAGGPATHEVLSALSATTDSGSFDFSYVLSQTLSPTNQTTTTIPCAVSAPTTVSPPVITMPTTSQGGGVVSGGIVGSGSSSANSTGSSVGSTGPGSSSAGGSGTGVPGSTSGGSVVSPGGPMLTTPIVRLNCVSAAAGPIGTVVSGQGTIDTNPMGMVATALVGPNQNGLSVSVRVDGTDYWELSGGDKSLAPTGTDANASPSGNLLHSFAGLVESTLGARPGAVAMMGMASPTGYLDLVSGAVTGAQQTGSTTVGGVTLTQYQVSIDPSQLATAPGTTPEEATTINDALEVLHQAGLTSISDTLSIDPTGYIRASTSVASFSDGGTVSLAAQFSDFGCAGTVLMPGQQGPSSPPVNCVSPDTGLPTTTTTTTTTTGSSTTVPPSTTTTAVAPKSTVITTTTTTVGSPSTTTTSTTGTTTSTTGTGSKSTTTAAVSGSPGASGGSGGGG